MGAEVFNIAIHMWFIFSNMETLVVTLEMLGVEREGRETAALTSQENKKSLSSHVWIYTILIPAALFYLL